MINQIAITADNLTLDPTKGMKHKNGKPTESMENKMLVDVYFNLHRKCFSVRCAKSRLVIAHRDEVLLEDVTFKVSEAGRQRVLREKKKNVHAVMRGTWVDMNGGQEIVMQSGRDIMYNPYKAPTFEFAGFRPNEIKPLKTARAAFVSTTQKNEKVLVSQSIM